MSILEFERVDNGWEACSSINDEGVPFTWRIIVTDAGDFSVNLSDSEICTKQIPNFSTFAEAKHWCDDEESKMIVDVNSSTKPPKEFCLGAYQQAWHMANAACNSLGLDYENTSPYDICVAINRLVRDALQARSNI